MHPLQELEKRKRAELYAKADKRPQKGMWAPGDYHCRCIKCDEQFIGDKRAAYCALCAYGDETR